VILRDVTSAAGNNPDSGKPLLLVDVDGVISLFGFDPDALPEGEWLHVDGILHLCSARAAEHLPGLGDQFELVWCTGWEEKANDYLPQWLGLPADLPFLQFERNPGKARAHWKLQAIDDFAGHQRPLAWIDDALDEACREWAAARTGPTLLVQTDPSTGLDEPHAAELRAWAAAL
jgi:HAD domain in Swiss Army Knife RNA repair proteins